MGPEPITRTLRMLLSLGISVASHQGNEFIEIVSKVRAYKSENNYSLKEEISKLIITGSNDFIKEAQEDLKAVCTINEIEYKQGIFDIEIIK